MDPWLRRAEDLCFEGEEITERVAIGEGGVVVTTHRVLAFTPERDGENFQQADRPNVEGVRRSDAGNLARLVQGGKFLAVGAILIGVGLVLDLEGLVGGLDLGSGGSAIGLGGVRGLFQTMLDLIAAIDDALVALGALSLLAASALFGVYLWTREPTLVVDVAGDEELAVPTEEWPEGDVVGRIERAIAPGERGPGDPPAGAPDDAPADGDPLA